MVNPTTGREAERPPEPSPATVKRRVLVVGGGPGGMEAAVLAAHCGHAVTLWETGPTLGGALRLTTTMRCAAIFPSCSRRRKRRWRGPA